MSELMNKAMDYWIIGLLDELASTRAAIHLVIQKSIHPPIHLTLDSLLVVAV